MEAEPISEMLHIINYITDNGQCPTSTTVSSVTVDRLRFLKCLIETNKGPGRVTTSIKN